MTDHASQAVLKPATPYLKFDGARPYLHGSRCRSCGAIFVGERAHCAACTARDAIEPVELSTRGRLYNYTVVHRSYPGVRAPFISAIVELEGGGVVKGNLLEVEPDAADLRFDLPVEVVFRGAEVANPAGAGFVSHFFVPVKERAE